MEGVKSHGEGCPVSTGDLKAPALKKIRKFWLETVIMIHFLTASLTYCLTIDLFMALNGL